MSAKISLLGSRRSGLSGTNLAIIFVLALPTAFVWCSWVAVDAVLLTPLPYSDSDRLVRLWSRKSGSTLEGITMRQLAVLRRDMPWVEAVGVYSPIVRDVGGSDGSPDRTRRLPGMRVSAGYFEALGIPVLRGRLFADPDEDLVSARVALASEALVARGVVRGVGDGLSIDGIEHRVVGIVRDDAGFGREQVFYWLPVALEADLPNAATHTIQYAALARLTPGADVETAAARGSSVLSATGFDAQVVMRSLHAHLISSVRPTLVLLQVAALILMGLATINAGWLYSLATRRGRRDCAIKAALGASRRRLIRGEIWQAAFIAMGTVLLALLFAWTLLGLSRSVIEASLPIAAQLRLSLRGAVFPAVVALGCACLATLPGTIAVTRDLIGQELLRQRIDAGSRLRLEYSSVVAQAAIALALTVQAGLLASVVYQMLYSQLGLEDTDVIAAHVTVPQGWDEGTWMLQSELLQALHAVGIDAAVANGLPLSHHWSRVGVRKPPDLRPYEMTGLRVVSRAYRDVVSLPLLAGRWFRSGGDEAVVIVNDVFARHHFGSVEDALEKQVTIGAMWAPASTVVGVVGAVRYAGLLEEPEPEAYRLAGSMPERSTGADGSFFVLGRARPGVADDLRAVLAARSAELEVVEVLDLRELLWSSTGNRPLITLGVGLFAASALLLMCIGTYGAVSDLLERRRQRIGIQLCIGASPVRIGREVAREIGTAWVVAVVCGLALTTLLRAGLGATAFVPEGVETPSLALFAGIGGAALGVVLLAASYTPIRRACRTDPLSVLQAP